MAELGWAFGNFSAFLLFFVRFLGGKEKFLYICGVDCNSSLMILTAVLVDDKDVNDMESAAEEISR